MKLDVIDESPVFFPSENETLFGIFTPPSGGSNGLGAVILQGGGSSNVTYQRNRIARRLAQQLADRGIGTLRFDYHGLGASTGQVDTFWLDQPFVPDLEAAAASMRAAGFERLLLIGTCFGGRTALAVAEKDASVVGVILVAIPIGESSSRLADSMTVGALAQRALSLRHLGGLLDKSRRRTYWLILRSKATALARRRHPLVDGHSHDTDPGWVNVDVMRRLRALRDRRIPTLLMYGRADMFYTHFREGLRGPLHNIVEDPIEVSDVITGGLHGYTSLDVQEQFLALVDEWVRRNGFENTAADSTG